MARMVKEKLYEVYQQQLEGVNECLVVDVSRLPSGPTAELRSHLRSNGARMHVVLNRVARKAVSGTDLDAVRESCGGMAALVYGGDDIVTLAKLLVDWRKKYKNEFLDFRGGVVDGQAVDKDGVLEISKLPSKQELRGKIVSCIAGPMIGLLNVIQGPGRGIVYALNARKEKLENH